MIDPARLPPVLFTMLRPHHRELPPVQQETFKAGKHPSCEVAVGVSPQVGRTHAIFRWTEAGLTVLDNNSANGVAVNGERLPPDGTPRVLASGDRLLLGDVLLEVVIVGGGR